MLDTFLMKFPTAEGEGARARPGGWTPVSGDPKVRSYRHYGSDDGSLISGRWECSTGVFDVVYVHWEFCHLLSGHCRITPEGGATVDLRPGDAFILEPGFRGRWEVVEDMAKHFVFKLTPQA